MVPSPEAVERAWSPPAFHDYGVQRLAGNDLRDLAVLHEPPEALALLAQALGEPSGNRDSSTRSCHHPPCLSFSSLTAWSRARPA